MRRRNHNLRKYENRKIKKGYRLIAGVDEVGVGPWAGPVVAACVILRDFNFKSKVFDSKQLSPNQRFLAFCEIMGKAHVGLGIVGPETIDSINIYNATRLAMECAIRNLRPKPDVILIDGRIRPKTKAPIENIIGGDRKSITVAASSIVAKVVRDGIMQGYDLLYPGYGFVRHKGYGTKEHRVALDRLGFCSIHRRSFRPVANLPSSKLIRRRQRPSD